MPIFLSETLVLLKVRHCPLFVHPIACKETRFSKKKINLFFLHSGPTADCSTGTCTCKGGYKLMNGKTNEPESVVFLIASH